jgi:hypothetical protein
MGRGLDRPDRGGRRSEEYGREREEGYARNEGVGEAELRGEEKT